MVLSRSRSLLSITVVAVLAAGFSSCSGSKSSAADQPGVVIEVVRSFLLAFDERNGDAFINLMSENLCTNGFGGPCSGLRADAANIFAGQPAIDIRSLADPVIDNNSASVELVGRIQGGLHHVHLGLVRAGDTWLVDDIGIDVSPPVALPAGVPIVDITLTEYAFAFDASKLSSGIFSLQVHNAGKLQHELVIKRVDTSAELDAELMDTETLAIPVAGIQAIDPGSTSNVVLAEQLPPGHYFIFCEVSDGAGQTHLQHGMSAEFTVGPSQ